MLDAYIIDRIKQEEAERRRQAEDGRRIQIELPVPIREPGTDGDTDTEDRGGPIIIPLHDIDDAA